MQNAYLGLQVSRLGLGMMNFCTATDEAKTIWAEQGTTEYGKRGRQ
jgi:hypothetical protein